MTRAQQWDENTKRVRAALDSLSEHFDTVQIFVTNHEPGTDQGGTGHCQMGAGNSFARREQVRDWLIEQEEMIREGIRRIPPET